MEAERLKKQSVRAEDKDSVDKICKEYDLTLSSHAFASIYLWKQIMGLTLELNDKFFSVKLEIEAVFILASQVLKRVILFISKIVV